MRILFCFLFPLLLFTLERPGRFSDRPQTMQDPAQTLRSVRLETQSSQERARRRWLESGTAFSASAAGSEDRIRLLQCLPRRL